MTYLLILTVLERSWDLNIRNLDPEEGGGVLGIRHGSCMKPSKNDCRREADLRIHNEPGFSVGLPIRTLVSDCGMSHDMW